MGCESLWDSGQVCQGTRSAQLLVREADGRAARLLPGCQWPGLRPPPPAHSHCCAVSLQRSDPQLLAQFYYADEELNQVAAELDSLDGRKDPQRCTLLVSQFRSCQVSGQAEGLRGRH